MRKRALSALSRGLRWRPGLYVLAGLAACSQAPSTAPPDPSAQAVAQAERASDPPRTSRVDPCECGPIDVVFVIDDTGSMGGALQDFNVHYNDLVDQIDEASSGDYQLGLVTFKDTVTVQENLALLNRNAVGSHIPLSTSGGGNEPEASDDALATVLAPGEPFFPHWRTGARKFIVLITDARPGGSNDAFDGGDVVHAQAQAQAANDQFIHIHSVYVTHGAPDPTIASIMQYYAVWSSGLYRQTLPNGTDTYLAVRDFLSGCRRPSDVWIQDHAADHGSEPHSLTSWLSPDIKVCHDPNGCTGVGDSPVYGPPGLNHVFVTLHNDGPNVAPPAPATGSLYLYYVDASGSSLWPADWHFIGVQHGVALAASQTRDVRIPWDNVPVPGHYCLLARWVSTSDPMTFPEGIDTYANTQRNNNIAWHNVDVIKGTHGTPIHGTFGWTAALGSVSSLVVDPFVPAPGNVVVDLGALFADWQRNGGKGAGITLLGGTQIRISAKGGSIDGVPAPRLGRAKVDLSFTIDQLGTVPVRVRQLLDGKLEQGGVEYQLQLVAPDAPPVAATVVAAVDAKGGVQLAWPHEVQHIGYVIWRSGDPSFKPGDGERIGALDAKTADVTSALTFTDPVGSEKAYFYRVESRSPAGSAFSDAVTASAASNGDK